MARDRDLPGLVERIYAGVLDAEGRDATLASIGSAVGAISGIIYAKPGHRVLASYGPSPPGALQRYLSEYEAISPMIGYFGGQPAGEIRAAGAFAFSPAYRATRFYSEWVRPQGWADMLGGHLVRADGNYAWIGLRREESRGVYRTGERRAAKRLAPHLAQAARLTLRVDSDRAAAIGVGAVFDSLAVAGLVVNPQGRVLRANRAAERLLAEGGGISVRRGQLVGTALLRAIAQAATGRAVPPLRLRSGDESRALTAEVVPLSGSGTASMGPIAAAAAVFVIDAAAVRERPLDGFAALHGLTPAETRLLAAIVTGCGVAAAAAAIGVAESTAKTHLARIYSKTGTSRQAELVGLVAHSVPPLVAPSRR